MGAERGRRFLKQPAAKLEPEIVGNLTVTQWVESKHMTSGISPLVHCWGIIFQSILCISVASEQMPGSASCESTVDKLLQRKKKQCMTFLKLPNVFSQHLFLKKRWALIKWNSRPLYQNLIEKFDTNVSSSGSQPFLCHIRFWRFGWKLWTTLKSKFESFSGTCGVVSQTQFTT